ncbi:ABC1 family-domain-containing protein, partial [Gorgonomyces haynaldii]
SQCHTRSAEKLLKLFRRNGGVYIKIGQSIGSMVYIVPLEYTEKMKELQDKCPPTPLGDVEGLFLQDLGVSIPDVFSSFEPEPLGVASLAQVHKAVLKPQTRYNPSQEPKTVAVKIQHPYLKQHAQYDIETCTSLVRTIKRFFPDFKFAWIATELELSLPNELDFIQEANNARKITQLTRHLDQIHIPTVFHASERIIIMEYIDGVRIDDHKYMKENKINVNAISAALGRMYMEMMFDHGFVHCDPHPGNLMVRQKPDNRRWYQFLQPKKNFEIILLDHGLYRQLKPEFQLDYAHLWDSIINGNEPKILKYSNKLFSYSKASKHKDIEHHRLTKTGGVSNIASVRSTNEINVVHRKAGTGSFLTAITDILAKLPRELLMLLRTHDILRSVDQALGVHQGREHILFSVVMIGKFTTESIYRNETQ